MNFSLLERAATNAGYPKDYQWNCRVLPPGMIKYKNSWIKWNPLEDVSQAIRLGIDAKVLITQYEDRVVATRNGKSCTECYTDDYTHALCYAIVRAAGA